MKKIYAQPTVKVVNLKTRQMLCISGLGINKEQVSASQNEFSGYSGYGNDW